MPPPAPEACSDSRSKGAASGALATDLQSVAAAYRWLQLGAAIECDESLREIVKAWPQDIRAVILKIIR